MRDQTVTVSLIQQTAVLFYRSGGATQGGGDVALVGKSLNDATDQVVVGEADSVLPGVFSDRTQHAAVDQSTNLIGPLAGFQLWHGGYQIGGFNDAVLYRERQDVSFKGGY